MQETAERGVVLTGATGFLGAFLMAGLIEKGYPVTVLGRSAKDMKLSDRLASLLRWLGISENNQGVTLKWITEDGAIQIAANIQGTALNIEGKFLTSNNVNLALKASYQLMSLIGKLCITSQSSRHVMTRNVGYYGGFMMPN